MSPRTARCALWLAALLLVPLPMLQFGARVPSVHHLLLGGVCVVTAWIEGGGGVTGLLIALFFGHAVVYALGLWGLASSPSGRTAARSRTFACGGPSTSPW